MSIIKMMLLRLGSFLKKTEKMHRVIFYLVFLFMLLTKSYGNVGALNDTPYKTFDKDSFTYIYSSEWESYLNWVIDFNERLHQHYQETFGFRLDEKTAISLTSTHNQIANAYATMIPYSQTVFYFGAAEAIDEFSVRSWVADLLIHESSHLYQLDAKRGLSRIGHTIFGNNLPGNVPIPVSVSPLVILPIPFFTHPNILLPTWILEGNGVFNESRFGNGGRLFSGASQALFYSLLKAGVLNETRLTNNGLYFPYKKEKYIVGGYFNLYLAERFGIETLNRFFWSHATHYINPLRINSTFKAHFGATYSELIVDFLESHKKQALKHKIEEGEVLLTSVQAAPLNRIGDAIVFLNAGDGRGDLELLVMKSDGQIKRRQKSKLYSGKVFWHEGKFKSATSRKVKRKYEHASLFDENGNDSSEFDSKLVQDMNRKNNKLYFKMTEGFHAPILYQDEQKIGEAHSSALLSEDGEAVYFRQFKDYKTCFKGTRPLFSIPGFYGAPMDLGPDGEIYFTGATATGSGLFVWQDGKIFRLGISDAVHLARRLQGNRFLLVEFRPHGYDYSLLSLNKKEETPSRYHFFFDNDSSGNLLQGLLNDSVRETAAAPSSSVAQNAVGNYSMLGNMRFSSWLFSHVPGDENGYFEVASSFVDPMDYNQLGLEYTNETEVLEQTVNVDYLVTRWLLHFGLSVEYEQLEKSKDLPAYLRDNTLLVELPVSYNLVDSYRWKMDLEVRPGYKQSLKNPLWTDYPISYESMRIYKRENAFLGFYPLRAFSLELESEQDFLDIGTKNTFSATTKGIYHLGDQYYLMGEANLMQTNFFNKEIGEELRDPKHLVPAITILGIKGRDQANLYGLRTGAMLKTVFDWNKQSSVWPIGVNRLSPGIFCNYFATNSQDPARTEQHFYQPGVTLKFELLLAHLITLPLEVNYILDEKKGSVVQLNISSEF